MPNRYRSLLLSTTALSGFANVALPQQAAQQIPATRPSPSGSGSLHLPQQILGADERGLVVSPPASATKDTVMYASTALDPQELRFALLLSDRLDFPRNNLFGIELNTDAQFLHTAGVLQRTRAFFSSSTNIGEDILAAQRATFRELDKREPGRWSLARGERSLSFPDSELDQGRGVLFQLHNAIPIPNLDVPLADILEFKLKRRPELLALRHHLEEIYQSILAAPDRPLAEATAMEKLDLALANHLKASRETGFKLVLGGLQAKLDLKLGEALGHALVAASAGTMVGVTDALQIGGLAALYSLGASVSLKRREKSTSPFEYVSLFHRDLF